MPPSAPRPHPIVKAAAVVLVVVAAAVGVWAGSFGRDPRRAPAHPEEAVAAPSPAFLPAVDSVPIEPTVGRGALLFEERCARCHTIGGGERRGPDLARSALRRDPRWVSAMILAPDSMFRTDSVARWLLGVHDVRPEDATAENPDLRALADFFAGFAPTAARRNTAPAPD
jgi:mono/diheme cytochrome c family protein